MVKKGEIAPRVRGGGRPGPRGFLFELSGGALCLDLANTVDNRATPKEKDHLTGWEDLVGWAEQTRVLDRVEARHLRADGRPGPRQEAEILREMVALREALFGIFSAEARGSPPPPEALERLNRALPGVLGSLRLARAGRGYAWEWDRRLSPAERIPVAVIDSASDLLSSPDLSRVRECEADGCAWLFIDRSRNRSRRWCDMTICGNRAKARRHYRKACRGRAGNTRGARRV